jgi:hypothetical protein
MNRVQKHALLFGSCITWTCPNHPDVQLPLFDSQEHARRAWALYGQQIFEEGDGAGSRPAAFWWFDMPPERRLGLHPANRGAALVYELIKAGAIAPLWLGKGRQERSEIAEIESYWHEYIRQAVSTGEGLAYGFNPYHCPRWFYLKHAPAPVEAMRAELPALFESRGPAQLAALLGTGERPPAGASRAG